MHSPFLPLPPPLLLLLVLLLLVLPPLPPLLLLVLPLLLLLLLLLKVQELVPFETALPEREHCILVDVPEIRGRNGIASGRRPRGVCSLEVECTVAAAGHTIGTIIVAVAVNNEVVLEVLLHKRDRHMPVLGKAQFLKRRMEVHLLLEQSGDMFAFTSTSFLDKKEASIVLCRIFIQCNLRKAPATR